jgi:DNA replication protein DnaC
MSQPTPSVSPELKVLMRRLKLGQLLATLPERLALARSHNLGHLEFLEQLFSDEVSRRDAASAGLRARAAKLDPHMVLEAWDESAKITYDRAVWSELVSLRFVGQARNAFIMGPSGWARPSWPPPSGTSPVGGASACTSSEVTGWPRG